MKAVIIQSDRSGVTNERDQVQAHCAELLFQSVERREEAVMITVDRNGVTHERDQVHAQDAELSFQQLERREDAVIVQVDRDGIILYLTGFLPVMPGSCASL